jgi:hypothetical protein
VRLLAAGVLVWLFVGVCHEVEGRVFAVLVRSRAGQFTAQHGREPFRDDVAGLDVSR